MLKGKTPTWDIVLESLEYWATKITNKTVANLFIVVFWLNSFIYPSTYNKEVQQWFTFIAIGFLTAQYLEIYVPKLVGKIFVDYLYNRVRTDYKFYLVEKWYMLKFRMHHAQFD